MSTKLTILPELLSIRLANNAKGLANKVTRLANKAEGLANKVIELGI